MSTARAEEEQSKQPSKVVKVVLTGGPCGGKSTVLSAVSAYLKGVGVDVYAVPEAATLLLAGGGTFQGLTQPQVVAFQGAIIATMMALEDSFARIAESHGRPALLLCDRGTMDTSAYMDPGDWTLLLDEHGWQAPLLRDARYDAVVHMATAADGAEAFYSTESNTTRTETPAQARAIDARLRAAWLGHPRQIIVGNEADFRAKVDRVIAAICAVVGVPAPAPAAALRKFALPRCCTDEQLLQLQLPADLPREEFAVEHVYLADDMRLQTRAQQNSRTYTLRTRHADDPAVVTERRLAPREFAALRRQADPGRSVVRKRLTTFLWQGLSLSVSRFEHPAHCRGVAYVEAAPTTAAEAEAADALQLPEWLHAGPEVSGDPSFDSWSISRHNC